ncbi:DUF2953 family protein [Herbinix hemicellulosilytica]|uniref:Putative membrane protein n=1 Tax=Herbinix hemicellulosilytica TaxID=1564487 RepID=A0A0H5SG28_HERHM|nr:DUF2953 domain-containing protein [Herbinix hemicellulosilytica]RBP60027.1 DUF2953 family protein [Herbinix hemicellulosilytica]CRZ33751.1 putative membrane protein [Herbinix hemicellulosilytica]
MISVLLFILKLIGFVILAVIGILLIVFLAVLFVPVRYKINANHGESVELNAVISWFFHIIHARIKHTENNWRILVKIFGILVFDSHKSLGFKKDNIIKNDETEHHKDADMNDDSYKEFYKTGHISSPKENTAENKVPFKDNDMPYKNEHSANKDTGDTDRDSNDVCNFRDRDEASLIKIESDYKDGSYEKYESETKADTKNKYRKISIEKFKRLFIKIKSRIVEIYERIIDRIKTLIEKLRSIKHKISLIYDFLTDEVNKEGFRFTYDCIKKLLRHIKPTKLKSRLVFGTGDPCSTGQILGLFGILYGFYGNDLNITPDFENKVFEGTHYAKGRIRLGTVAFIVIKFLLDKRFKELKRNYQLLKEAL